jgi:phospholipid/cholesterol/gamma-HCH transport system substrate-binding protein
MEVRASYAVVGAFVLALVTALAGFVVWLARVEIDRSVDVYEVAFTGSVSGLQEGSAVRYRGVPVGRVASIRINPDNIEEILVRLELQAGTPVRADTVATVEMQGITGIASIQLSGGTQAAPMLEPHGAGGPPRITAGRSALEQVFDTTPIVLSRIAAVLERMGILLNEENLNSINAIIDDLEDIMDAINETRPLVETMIGNLGTTAARVGDTAALVSELLVEARGVVGQLDGLRAQGEGALGEVAAAARSFRALGTRLEAIVRRTEQPIGDFSESTLYELRQLVAEMRQLVAATSRITREFERDPAGYLLGAQQKGFQPQ